MMRNLSLPCRGRHGTTVAGVAVAVVAAVVAAPAAATTATAATPATTPAAMRQGSAWQMPHPNRYTVRAGDTWTSIAHLEQVPVRSLEHTNQTHGRLVHLRPGTVIRVPATQAPVTLGFIPSTPHTTPRNTHTKPHTVSFFTWAFAHLLNPTHHQEHRHHDR